MEIKEYKVTISVKNNLLYSAIMATGCKNIKEFSLRYKIPYSSIIPLISMRDSPVTACRTKNLSDGNIWKPVVIKICSALNTIPENLFTDRQVNYTGKSKKMVEISENEIVAFLAMQQQCLTGNDPLLQIEDNSEQTELKRALEKALETLSTRERLVIIYRFGLFEHDEHTLDDCAANFNVTRERIRQIEAKALRKLRHPSRLAHLSTVDTAPYKSKWYLQVYERENKND